MESQNYQKTDAECGISDLVALFQHVGLWSLIDVTPTSPPWVYSALPCPVWASIIVILLISSVVRTDCSQLHTSDSQRPWESWLLFLILIQMYKPRQLTMAGRNGVHVERGIVLILVSCPVFINWFSPFSHVGRGYFISNYIRQKPSIKILWQSPAEWGLTYNFSHHKETVSPKIIGFLACHWISRGVF